MKKIHGKSGRRILVVDVGGTHIKIIATGQKEEFKIPSGAGMTAAKMVSEVLEAAKDWQYDVVTIGYPGPVLHGLPLHEPHNLGSGWVGFDFEKAFQKPVKILNDAAMQALGGYQGGRMLFLGLGTGLGSALIIEGQLEAMELAHLPYKKGRTYEEYVGAAGLERLGRQKWQRHVFDVVNRLREAMGAEYVLLGGGNAKKLSELPQDTRLGGNDDAVAGGRRVWEERKSQ